MNLEEFDDERMVVVAIALVALHGLLCRTREEPGNAVSMAFEVAEEFVKHAEKA